jgi:hypothetical protein
VPGPYTCQHELLLLLLLLVMQSVPTCKDIYPEKEGDQNYYCELRTVSQPCTNCTRSMHCVLQVLSVVACSPCRLPLCAEHLGQTGRTVAANTICLKCNSRHRWCGCATVCCLLHIVSLSTEVPRAGHVLQVIRRRVLSSGRALTN